jgi:ATP-dependent helicase YprA (DUF1998 family)
VTDLDTGRVIDRLDKFRAMRLFYPGAVYLHHGETYVLVHHDTDRNLVTVRRADVGYYTDPRTGTSVDHVDVILDHRPLGAGTAFLGEVYARLETPVYERVRFYTMDRVSQHPTGLPSLAYEAMAFWVEPPEQMAKEVNQAGLNAESGLQGILYCVSRILPLFLTCDQNDFDWSLGCRNAPWQTMFWFEFYLHGIGNSESCYDRLEEILATALDHLLTCDCLDGCPNCTSRLITPYHVRNIELGEGEVHSRRAAAVMLNGLLNRQGVERSLNLLRSPSRPKGQRCLPSVVDKPKLAEPHRMPLDERTHDLLLRKIERSRAPKPDIHHPIEPVPPQGATAERAETLDATDAERRSGQPAIRRAGDPLARRIRRRLSTEPAKVRPLQGGAEEPPKKPAATPIQAGDQVARRARRRGGNAP